MPILTLKFAGQCHAEIVNVHTMLSHMVKHPCAIVQTQIHGENIILIFMKYLINYKVLEEYESFTQVSDLANEIFI